MVLFSAEPRVYTNDVDYHYRQENNLYYLTGIKQDGATLVLIPGAKRTREILFMPQRDPRDETWNGQMMSADEARARSGIAGGVGQRACSTGSSPFWRRAPSRRFAKRGAVSKPDAKLAAAMAERIPDLDRSDREPIRAEIYLLAPSTGATCANTGRSTNSPRRSRPPPPG